MLFISKFLPFLGIGDGIIALLLLIDAKIYGFVSSLYSFYVDLAKAKIFNSSMYQDIASKVYLIMGVAALFILIYTLLQSIVNPDGIKKTGADFVKRFVIGIIMVVLTPAIFNYLYVVQDAILSENVIPKLLLIDESESSITYEYKDESGKYIFTDDCNAASYDEALQKCTKATTMVETDKSESTLKSYGNEMAWIVLNAFLYRSDGVIDENKDGVINDNDVIVNASEYFGIDDTLSISAIACAVAGTIATVVIVGVEIYTSPTTGFATLSAIPGTIATFSGTIGSACGIAALGGAVVSGIGYAITYDKYTFQNASDEIRVNGTFDRITSFATAVNDGRMNYTPFVSTICGLIMIYLLLSYCLDLGVRAAKLAFYQLLAPVTMLMYTLPDKKDLLGNWFKAVLTTWAEVFIRIFTMCAIAYLISNLNNTELADVNLLAKAVIVLGLVTFAKQFPKLLGDITGIKSENMKLGIMDKLNAGTFGLAGGLVGGFTGAIGGAIASKRYGGTIMGGLASGAAGGFQGRGNQWKKQANKQYANLTGDHKGKVGIFGGKTVGTRINNHVGAMQKRSQNIATVDRNNRIAKNKEELANIEKAWLGTNVDEKQRIADFEMSGEYQTVYRYVQTDEAVQRDIEKAQREWEIANTKSAKDLTADEYAAKKRAAFAEISETKLRAATQNYMRKYYTQGGADHKDYRTDTNSTAQYLRDLDKNNAAEKQYIERKTKIEKAIQKDEKIKKDLGQQQANDEWVKNMREMFKQTGLDKDLKKDDKK